MSLIESGSAALPTTVCVWVSPECSSLFIYFYLYIKSDERTSWTSTGNSPIPGIRVPGFLRNRSSAGLTPDVLCGVVLCIIRKELSSSFQFLFSICAIFILFSRERFCLSTCPFAWGQSGVTRLYSMRSSSTNLQNSSLMNCDPLSVVILTGNPWVRNIFLRLTMTLSAVVDLKTSTSI